MARLFLICMAHILEVVEIRVSPSVVLFSSVNLVPRREYGRLVGLRSDCASATGKSSHHRCGDANIEVITI